MVESLTDSRFFFVIRWSHCEDDDPEGITLPSELAAVAYAKRVIQELKEAGGYDDPALTMIVKDAAGKVLITIPFSS